jgi:hypothetical protein
VRRLDFDVLGKRGRAIQERPADVHSPPAKTRTRAELWDVGREQPRDLETGASSFPTASTLNEAMIVSSLAACTARPIGDDGSATAS